MCEIEAAGPEGIILSFNNEFICGRIINEERVRDEFENSVGRIYGDAKKTRVRSKESLAEYQTGIYQTDAIGDDSKGCGRNSVRPDKRA